ncbi:MAG: MFS transporter [Hyphomonadaceae bacterium]|nr:MFS transporter [Hyphomonadaceae bacterium]
MAQNALAAEGETAVSRQTAWYVLGLLAALYAVSFLDRGIMALITQPVSRDLGLNDAEMGVVLGVGFAAMYALMGMPAAQFIDQRGRKTIIVIGVIVWSLGTIASAFAHDFATLTLCRATVASGEAVLTPAAISLIADLFPPNRRALPMSIYASMPSVMTGGTLLAGGAALHLATALADETGLAPWRGTLLLVGLPGLILITLFLLTVREPRRTGSAEAVAGQGASVRELVDHLRERWRFYVPFYLGASLLVMYAYAQSAWLPTLLVRAHGVSPENSAYLLALAMPLSLAGTFLYPMLARRFDRRGGGDGLVTAFMIAAILVTPLMILVPRAPSIVAVIAGTGLLLACLSTTSTLSPLAMQTFGPSRMRARLMALSLLCSSLLGFALGPTLVGYMSSRHPGDPNSIGDALSLLGVVLGPCAAVCFALCRPAARRFRMETGI